MMKNYIPLSEIEKPSLSGRVKQYMQKLNEEENEAKRKAELQKRKRETEDLRYGILNPAQSQATQMTYHSKTGVESHGQPQYANSDLHVTRGKFQRPLIQNHNQRGSHMPINHNTIEYTSSNHQRDSG